jgi:hypothetical protein
MEDLKKVIIEIQDYLVPILDTYEQAIYHYIFRHTYLIELEATLFSSKRAQIGFGAGAEGAQPSEKSRSKKLKSLELKGAVKILERSHKGMLVAIVLPENIPGLIKSEESFEVDIESLDFYKDRRLLPSILEREGYRCFYSGKKITAENCYLDHVVASSTRGDNSYKNIVASSYDANSMKNNKAVGDFIRQLYKEEIISLIEFDNLKKKIEDLQKGMLLPNKESVKKAIES